MDCLPLNLDDRACRPALNKLSRLFGQMDAAYKEMADIHGFNCDGCRDNCCQTRFHHHTLLEYGYIRKGLRSQAGEDRKMIHHLARQVEAAGPEERLMCPLNLAGRCRLYRFRPMICRLHGIAHEFIGPDQSVRKGPGCDEYTHCTGNHPDAHLNRTPFYRKMALLEKELRQRIGFNGRVHMTIAQMVLYAESETF